MMKYFNLCGRLLIILIFHTNIKTIDSEEFTSLQGFTTIGRKQCEGECYNRGSCQVFSYNREHLSCVMFINNVTTEKIANNEYVYEGQPQNGLIQRKDIIEADKGPCSNHECPRGSTCFSFKDQSRKCLHTECASSPPSVANAFLTDARNLYKLKDSVNYDCQAGYLRVGDYEVICRAGGRWSNVNFQCKDCGPPPALSNAHVDQIEGLTIGKFVYYQCDPGYQATGVIQIECFSDTVWSKPSRICLPMCQLFPVYPNAQQVTVSSWLMLGQTVEYSCNIGYEPPTFTIECVNNTVSNDSLVMWSDPTENCRKVDCLAPLDVDNASYGNVTVTTYLEVVQYECIDNMTLSGDVFTSTCQANKSWTEPNLFCSECGNLPTMDGIDTMTVFRGRHNTITLTCTSDYISTGTVTAQCNNGTWDIGDFICWWKHCGTPSVLYGAQRTFTGTIVGDVTTHTCTTGFVDVANVGNVKSTCQLGGNWSDVFINCSRNCFTPPAVTNAVYPSGVTTYEGSVVYYSCNSRFTMVGDLNNITCLTDGTWTASSFQCVPDCKQPPAVTNANPPNYNSTLQNNYALYTCMNGYTVIGNPTITCQSTSIWTTVMFVCVACTYPPPVLGTSIIVILNAGVPTVTYSCENSMNLIGNGEMSCQSGSWLGSPFFCAGCTNPPTVQGSTSEVDLSSTEPRIKYTCTAGLTFVGSEYITCPDVLWTDPLLICSECPYPTLLTEATMKVTLVNNIPSVTYTCNNGATLIGIGQITCQTGVWSEFQFTCSACLYPPSVTDATIAVSTTGGIHTVIYVCNSGTVMLGSADISCVNNAWTNAIFLCSDCSYPPSVASATYAVDMAYGDKAVKYTCDSPLTMIGDQYLSCQNQAWTQLAFVCSECSYPPSIADTEISVVTIGGVRTVTYNCINSKTMIGDGSITCQSGIWSNRAFICSDCSYPPSINNAIVDVTLVNGVMTTNYVCNNGFNMYGDGLLTCLNGAWSTSLVMCSACSNPPPIIDTTVQLDLTGSVLKATYSCNVNKYIFGDGLVTCNAGTWTNPNFFCSDCFDPPTITGTTFNVILSNGIPTATFSCINGQTMIGDGVITCNAGSWTQSSFFCIDCSDPPTITGTTVSVILSNGIPTATYTCINSQNIIGDGAITCTAGSWTQIAFFCTDCSDPPTITGTTVSVILSNGIPTATYSCINGQNMIGDGVITCNAGSWTQIAFFCTDCSDPPTITGTTVSVILSNGIPTATYSCTNGQTMIGDDFITCNAISWTQHGFLCTDCGQPPLMPNANLIVQRSSAGYNCQTGYSLTGTPSLDCNTGSWVVGNFTCI